MQHGMRLNAVYKDSIQQVKDCHEQHYGKRSHCKDFRRQSDDGQGDQIPQDHNRQDRNTCKR